MRFVIDAAGDIQQFEKGSAFELFAAVTDPGSKRGVGSKNATVWLQRQITTGGLLEKLFNIFGLGVGAQLLRFRYRLPLRQSL